MRSSQSNFRQSLSDAIVRGDLNAVQDAVAHVSCDELSSEGLTPLMEAVRCGKQAIAEFLLSKGADVNARSKSGVTVLVFAASRCRPGIVEALLRRGATLESGTFGNKSAPDAAAAAGDWASMRLLLQARAARRDLAQNAHSI
ncbi:MAG TPA: ankyrin repeat domain-containing protein [Tepidisphaeraceae bacterium]|nr:ankyrin repeat domain-containing protein [Tepidisphaeraceae bacterium]